VNSLGIPNRDSHDLRHNLAETINTTRKLALETNKVMKDYADLSGRDPKVNIFAKFFRQLMIFVS